MMRWFQIYSEVLWSTVSIFRLKFQSNNYQNSKKSWTKKLNKISPIDGLSAGANFVCQKIRTDINDLYISKRKKKNLIFFFYFCERDSANSILPKIIWTVVCFDLILKGTWLNEIRIYGVFIISFWCFQYSNE